VLGDAIVLIPAAHHEAGDVLQEDQRYRALRAEFDEVRALHRRFAEQDSVVGNDSDRHPVEPGEAGHQRRSVSRLELVEARAVDDPGNDLSNVVGLCAVSCGITP